MMLCRLLKNHHCTQRLAWIEVLWWFDVIYCLHRLLKLYSSLSILSCLEQERCPSEHIIFKRWFTVSHTNYGMWSTEDDLIVYGNWCGVSLKCLTTYKITFYPCPNRLLNFFNTFNLFNPFDLLKRDWNRNVATFHSVSVAFFSMN